MNQRLLDVLYWGSGLTIFAAVLIACALAWSLGRAVGAVADAAQEISGGNLARRVGMTRGDEIGRAAAAFDGMAERLEHSVARRISWPPRRPAPARRRCAPSWTAWPTAC